jgi:hypothetical protein
VIDAIEASGLLDERWIEERIDLLAREELKRSCPRPLSSSNRLPYGGFHFDPKSRSKSAWDPIQNQ